MLQSSNAGHDRSRSTCHSLLPQKHKCFHHPTVTITHTHTHTHSHLHSPYHITLLSPDCKHKNCFLPSSVTSRFSERFFYNPLLVLPWRSNNVSVRSCLRKAPLLLYCCQRVVTVTCRVRRSDKATRQWTSHFLSAHERARRLLCATTTATTRADLVGTTLKGTETFVSRKPLRTTAAERFENIALPNHSYRLE